MRVLRPSTMQPILMLALCVCWLLCGVGMALGRDLVWALFGGANAGVWAWQTYREVIGDSFWRRY